MFSIHDKGIPNPKTGKRGDLVVEFEVRFPDSLPTAAKELIGNALPPNWLSKFTYFKNVKFMEITSVLNKFASKLFV